MSNKKTKNKKWFLIMGVVLLVIGYGYAAITRPFDAKNHSFSPANSVLASQFEYLSQKGNSSCSSSFQQSIQQMPNDARLQGSCCSPMSYHRYKEQVDGLKKYSNIKEIPPDPYDIEAGLAKKLMAHYDDVLTLQQQRAYDYAMANSHEKGPCCCKCWRWYVYGGLAKLLIKERGFTGAQITEIWNLSDGCGGEGDHVNHG